VVKPGISTRCLDDRLRREVGFGGRAGLRFTNGAPPLQSAWPVATAPGPPYPRSGDGPAGRAGRGRGGQQRFSRAPQTGLAPDQRSNLDQGNARAALADQGRSTAAKNLRWGRPWNDPSPGNKSRARGRLGLLRTFRVSAGGAGGRDRSWGGPNEVPFLLGAPRASGFEGNAAAYSRQKGADPRGNPPRAPVPRMGPWNLRETPKGPKRATPNPLGQAARGEHPAKEPFGAGMAMNDEETVPPCLSAGRVPPASAKGPHGWPVPGTSLPFGGPEAPKPPASEEQGASGLAEQAASAKRGPGGGRNTIGRADRR